jgi:hypothetical protein
MHPLVAERHCGDSTGIWGRVVYHPVAVGKTRTGDAGGRRGGKPTSGVDHGPRTNTGRCLPTGSAWHGGLEWTKSVHGCNRAIDRGIDVLLSGSLHVQELDGPGLVLDAARYAHLSPGHLKH